MPTLTHANKAQEEHEQDAARQKDETSYQRERRERTEFKELGPSQQQARLREASKEVEDRGARLIGSVEQAVEKMKQALVEEDRRRDASFQPTGGAGPSVRDDLRRTQEEALARTQSSERREQIERVDQCVQEAARSVVHAAQSMSARHPAEQTALRVQLEKELAVGLKADQEHGKLSAGEVLARQKEREAEVLKQLATLRERQLADTVRLQQLEAGMRQAIRAFMEDVQKELGEGAGRSHEQRMEQSNDKLKAFDEQRVSLLAERLIWDGRLSDIEAVKKTWERAAQGCSNTKEGFADARKKFWELVHNSKDDGDAQLTRRLIEKVGVEWQGPNAPLLAVEAERIALLKEAAKRGDQKALEALRQDYSARRITIDHVSDKSTTPERTLDASNLRFMDNSDNRSRGRRYDTSEDEKLDYQSTTEEKGRNAALREEYAGERIDKVHGRLKEKTVWYLQEQQRSIAADHQKALESNALNRAERERALLGSGLRLEEVETEDARRTRRDDLLKASQKFEDASSKQIQELIAFERRLHDQQSNDLSRALELVAEAQKKQLEAEKNQLKDPVGPSHHESLKRVQALEKRITEEQSAMNALWADMAARRDEDERRLTQAIHKAATREEQERRLERAVEEQRKNAEHQRRRQEELERERSRHA